MTTEIACKEAMFSFNKHHLVDPTVPMWTLKTGGKTFYVNHVTCDIPWTTKETPDSSHTKGSIKIKKSLLTIDDDNCATFTTLSNGDMSRIRAAKRHFARLLITPIGLDSMKKFFRLNSIEHDEIKQIKGSCGSSLYLCDIKKKSDMVLLQLAQPENFRILQANEVYFKAYDDPELLAKLDANDYYDGEEDDDDEDID